MKQIPLSIYCGV